MNLEILPGRTMFLKRRRLRKIPKSFAWGPTAPPEAPGARAAGGRVRRPSLLFHLVEHHAIFAEPLANLPPHSVQLSGHLRGFAA